MNKKAQLDHPIVSFFILSLGLIFIAIILMKIFIAIQVPMHNAFGNMSDKAGPAQANFDTVMNTTILWWDKVIIFVFILALVLLVISSIMIDTSPFWIVLYIFINFMLILFAGDIMSSADTIYNNYASLNMPDPTLYLPMTNFIREHYSTILVGVMFLTGIIIYGKVFIFNGGQRR